MALAGFALPECPGSSSRVYPALEGLAAVVHRRLVPPPSRVGPSMCTPVTPAVPYLLLDLHDVQWAVGNSRGARKLARTPHVNQKKKKRTRSVRLQGEVNFHLIFDFINTASPPNFIRGKARSQVAIAIRFWLMAHLFNNFLVADGPILEAADYAKSQITGCSLYFWVPLTSTVCVPLIYV